MKCSVAWLYWFIGILIFCIDRITKNAALASCMERIHSGIACLSYEVTTNRGFSWGIFHSENEIMFIIISLFIAFITGLICLCAYASYKREETIVGYVCVIAGSLSNIIDRIFYQGVIDFMVISLYGYSWPAFNIADIAIVMGLGIIFLQHIKNE